MIQIALIKPPQATNEVQPPLGLGYLASSVENLAETEIIDSIKDKLNILEVLKRLQGKKFDIIGLQCYTVDFNTVKTLVNFIRKFHQNSIIVLGGPHPTLAPEDTLNNIAADYLFLGDSEISFSLFVNLLKQNRLNKSALRKIPGFAYRDKDKIRMNKIKFPENLDDYNPSWHLYDLRSFPVAPHGSFCKQYPVAPLIVTRGCPFNCAYCGGPKISGRKIRSHSVGFVIRQIEILVKKYGIREIHIEDDNFTMNREFVREFCNELIKKNLGITWFCPNGIRVDTLDENLVKLMKKSGLYIVSIGIESGSDRIRKLMRKNLDTKTIESRVKMIKKCGIDIIGLFIVGYPGETVDDINKTIDFACKLPLLRATFSAFKPFPGTDIYQELIQKGTMKKIDYSHFTLDRVVWSPEGISMQELKNLRRKAFIRFYLRPQILFKMLRDIKTFENFKFILIRIYRWMVK